MGEGKCKGLGGGSWECNYKGLLTCMMMLVVVVVVVVVMVVVVMGVLMK